MPKFGPKTSADLLLLLDFESARGQELQQNVSSDTTVDAVFCTLVDILDEDVEGALWIKPNKLGFISDRRIFECRLCRAKGTFEFIEDCFLFQNVVLQRMFLPVCSSLVLL